MTDQNKKLTRMSDELWQSYDLFRDPLQRRGDPVLVRATIKDVYQLYRFMSGMDSSEAANPELVAFMGDELAQAYDLFKDPIRRAGDPVLVLDVLENLDDMCNRMAHEAGFELALEDDANHVSDAQPRF
jgi:hypothetical protein